jgi:YD repeat-containing protein
MAMPKGIIQREFDKFIEDKLGKTAVRTYDTAMIELNRNYTQLIEYDGNGNAIYIGGALPGTAQASTGWQIKRLSYDGSGNMTAMEWADGDDNYDNVWGDRASLSYS